MKSRKSLALYAGGGVAAALFLAAGILLYLGIGEFQAGRKSLSSLRSKLEELYGRDPFPSQENIERQTRNRRELEEEFGVLLDELGAAQVEPDPRQSPSRFKDFFSAHRITLTSEAASRGVALPEGFAFGFDRYSGALLPQRDDVARLVQQLLIIENLCRVLYEGGVWKIHTIQRQAFEVAGEPEGRGTERRPSIRPVAARRAAPAETEATLAGGPQAGILGADDLFATLHFAVEFTCKESAMLEVLNRLAAHPMIVVVTRLSLEHEKQEGGARAGTPAPAAAAPEGEQKNVVFGLETPLHVRLEMDVYRFRKKGVAGS